MKARYQLLTATIFGVAAGGAVVHGLHAQAKLPAFAVVEIDIANREAFQKEYSPAANDIMNAAGAKYLTRGPSKKVTIDGEPVKPTTVILQFESLEKAQAAFASSEYQQNRKIGDKYAKFRIWIAEGAAQ